MSRLASVFALNRSGLNVSRGIEALAILAVPFVVLTALDDQVYMLSAIFGVLFVALSDPGGEYRERLRAMGGVAIGGTLITALGFAVGGGGWGLIVLVAFIVTLAGGLALQLGLHRFVAAELINYWLLVTLGLPASYELSHIATHAWSQALAWLIGATVWIVVVFIGWVARGRASVPSHFPEIPSDSAPIALTRPLVLFAVIRAVALSIAVAIAFGFKLPKAYWMPIATLVAMKPSLEQSALAAEQRLAGAIIGATTAALFLLTVHDKHALAIIIVILGAIAASIRGVNYALYCAAVASTVLVATDLPHPTNLAAEGRRVAFTFIGVGIGVVVMFIANVIQKRSTAVPPST